MNKKLRIIIFQLASFVSYNLLIIFVSWDAEIISRIGQWKGEARIFYLLGIVASISVGALADLTTRSKNDR